MANLNPNPEWLGVPQLEVDDYAEGGPEGKANEQAQALLNMLQWLIVRGLGTAYDANITYAPGALTMKDGSLQIFDGENWTNVEADHKSLKKAANLSDLVDLVASRANLGVYSKEEVDTLRNQVPIGTATHWLGARSAIPDGWLPYDGYTYNRADYPELWALIASGVLHSVSDATWLASSAHRGKFSTGNGSTTFRTPDLNGIQSGSLKSPVMRGDGYSAPGGMLGDAIRDMEGHMSDIAGGNDAQAQGASGVLRRNHIGSWPGLAADSGSNRFLNFGGYTFKASYVMPTADENRPNSAFYVVIGKVRGSTGPDLAEHAPATTGANRFDGSQSIFGNLEVSGEYTGDLTKNVRAAMNAEGPAPMFSARAWACFKGTGTISIYASGNVLSITDLDVGRYLLNISANLPGLRLASFCSASEGSAGSVAVTGSVVAYDNQVLILTNDSSGANLKDFEYVSAAVIG